MTSLVREVLKEGAKLGLSRVERLVFVLAAALVIVLAKLAGKKLAEAAARAFRNAAAQIVADENGPQPPGEPLPVDSGNPGGGKTGGMG